MKSELNENEGKEQKRIPHLKTTIQVTRRVYKRLRTPIILATPGNVKCQRDRCAGPSWDGRERPSQLFGASVLTPACPAWGAWPPCRITKTLVACRCYFCHLHTHFCLSVMCWGQLELYFILLRTKSRWSARCCGFGNVATPVHMYVSSHRTTHDYLAALFTGFSVIITFLDTYYHLHLYSYTYTCAVH